MLPTRSDGDKSSWKGERCIDEHDIDTGGDSIVTTSHTSSHIKNTIKTKPRGTAGEESLKKDDCENDRIESVNSTVKVDVESATLAAAARRVISNDEGLGLLSKELANIGHIDSSETSDDSPEGEYAFLSGNIILTRVPTHSIYLIAAGSTFCKEEIEAENELEIERKKRVGIDKSSICESIKESEHSFPISIEGVFNASSELDMTNLFSTSPEEEEEYSEEYRREMGLEPIKRCSIAHFIEGSDIARKSIKCRHRNKSVDDLENECIAVVPECRSLSESEQKVNRLSLNSLFQIGG